MKKIKLFLVSVICLASFVACGDDDEFYNSKYVSIPGLIQIENQNDFTPGDFLYIYTNFSRFQPEPNQITPLDIFQTTNGASFSFAFGVEKNINGIWTIQNTENVVAEAGTITEGFYLIGESIYNSQTQTYEFSAGIPLMQTGEYRIFFGFSAVSQFELSSNNLDETSTRLTIKTTANNLSDGYYYFSVQ